MREIELKTVTEKIKEACIRANKVLPADLESIIRNCAGCEKTELAKKCYEYACR